EPVTSEKGFWSLAVSKKMSQKEQGEKYHPFQGHLLTLKKFQRTFCEQSSKTTNVLFCLQYRIGRWLPRIGSRGNQYDENLFPGHFFCQILQRIFAHNLKNVFLFSDDVRASRKQTAHDTSGCKVFA